jgi:hypothetical protein
VTHDPGDYVILVEAFELLRPLEEFAPLIRPLMKRLETGGVETLASMQFFVKEASTREMGAVLVFRNASQLQAHVAMISSWPEFGDFSKSIRLTDMRIHGRITPELEAFVRSFQGPVAKYERFLAGFVRPTPVA